MGHCSQNKIFRGGQEGMTKVRKFTINGEEISAEIERIDGFLRIKIDDEVYEVQIEAATGLSKPAKPKRTKRGSKNSASGSVFSSIPGKVVSIDVAVGDAVQSGQTILILEAMKMQNEIVSGIDGVVVEVNVSEGESVEANFLLAKIEPEPHD